MIELLIIRHDIADDQDAADVSDEQIPVHGEFLIQP